MKKHDCAGLAESAGSHWSLALRDAKASAGLAGFFNLGGAVKAMKPAAEGSYGAGDCATQVAN